MSSTLGPRFSTMRFPSTKPFTVASFHSALPQEETRFSRVFQVFHLATKKCVCISPITIGGCARDAHRLGGFLVGQSGEVAQLDQPGFFLGLGLQLLQRLVKGKQLAGAVVGQADDFIQVDSLPFATVFWPSL